MSKLKKCCIGAGIALVLIAILTFFVTSLCMASAHGFTVVQEWQNWFGIAQEAENALETVTGNATALLNIIA